MQKDAIDLQAIDVRTLPPERWDVVQRQAARRARLERSRACRELTAACWRGALAWVRRILSAGQPAGYPN